MSDFVLDCSVTISWCFSDENTPATRAILERLQDGQGAVVPALWWWETANVLLLGTRRGRLTPAQLENRLALLTDLAIETDTEPVAKSWVAARMITQVRSLTVYDASYLELAVRRGLPLATRDRALARACLEAGVPVLGGDP